MPLDQDPPLTDIGRSGFVYIDTQLPFVLNLRSVSKSISTDKLQAVSADDEAFQIAPGETAPFTHERFRYVPGCSGQRVDERYSMWATEIAERFPGTCLRINLEGKCQGWFLAEPGETGRLTLSLAMLSRNATISGMLLYQKACLGFAEKGYRLGQARFSITNTAVHNMYSALNARFLAPEGCWLWVKQRSEK
jgi:hypothetical protein